MPHNKAHKSILALDKVRHELDGVPVLNKGTAIIDAVMEGDEAEAVELILDQVVPFNDDQQPLRVKGADIGEDLGKGILEVGRA